MDDISERLFQGLLNDFMRVLPLVIPEFESRDDFVKSANLVNECIINEGWLDLNATLDIVLNSKFSEDRKLMKELIRKINIPQKHWKALEKENSENCLPVLRLICFCSNFGDKNTIIKYFVDWGGHLSVQKHFANNLCSEDGKFYCLGILTNFVRSTDDQESARLVLPAAKHFKDMVLENNVTLRVMDRGVKLIHMIASVCHGSGHLIAEIFKSGLSSYSINVCSECNKLDQADLDDINTTNLWNSLCWTISVALPEKSVSFNMGDLPALTQNLCEIMEATVCNMNDEYEINIVLLVAVVTSLYELVERANEQGNLVALKDFGITTATVKILQNVFSAKTPGNHDHELKHNCYMLISAMINVEPNVRTIAPVLVQIEKSFVKHPIPDSFAYQVCIYLAKFCFKAVERGSADDVKYLVDKGLLPLLAIATVDIINDCSEWVLALVKTLYHVILTVPETDDFSIFEKQHLNTMFFQFSSSNISSANKRVYGYVIAAIGVSSMKTNTEKFKLMNDFFHDQFQIIERRATSVTRMHPESFILRKMIKVNCFKINVLSHIWYLVNNGSKESVKNLYGSLPETESHTKVSTKKEMREQVLEHLLEEVKTIIDRQTEYSIADLIKLTNFLTLIPCQDQCDIVMYHLEDLVSYCLDLIESQNNRKIVTNVKKFIQNLHYS